MIKAMAAKLARLIYRMLRYGMQYVDRGAQIYEDQYRQRQIAFLKRKAAELGLKVVEAVAALPGVSGELLHSERRPAHRLLGRRPGPCICPG